MPISEKITIAVDTRGADFSPKNEVLGAIEAVKESSGRFTVLLLGESDVIQAILDANDAGANPNLSVIEATETITMDDEPVAALRTKPNSSIVKGFDTLKNGSAQAFVSAGNTGAVMSGATLLLGRIQGVTRPTIGAQFPRGDGGYTLVFDVGATVDAKPQWLKEYAMMADIYARDIFGVKNPKIALLSVGEEDAKGNQLVFEAAELLRQTRVNFVGNVEGRDILGSKADIILCDGFTGNIMLKFAESVLGALKGRIKNYASKGFVSKLKAGITANVLRDSLKDFDYQEHGGVPLLGVNGVVIIGHGRSSPKAIKNMIFRAEEMINKSVIDSMRKAFV